jgi:hypothetical protein
VRYLCEEKVKGKNGAGYNRALKVRNSTAVGNERQIKRRRKKMNHKHI